MKRILFLALFFVASASYSQTLAWEWVSYNDDTSNAEINAVATDSAGNVYAFGDFTHKLIVGTDTLVSNGSQDIFIAKYSPSGSLVWIKSYGGNLPEETIAVNIDASGHLIIYGIFYSYVLPLGGDTLWLDPPAPSSTNLYIAKFDLDGDIIWAKSVTGNTNPYNSSMTTDAAGNIFISSVFDGTANFDGISLTSSSFGSSFLAKYDAGGNIIWVKDFQGPYLVDCRNIAVDAHNRIYVSGYYNYSSLTIDGITVSNNGGADCFVARLNSLGVAQWVKGFGGNEQDVSTDIKVDHNGDILVGAYYRSAMFNVGTLSVTNFDAPYPTLDFLIAKMDSLGNFKWVKHFGGDEDDDNVKMAIDAGNNIYFKAGFESSALAIGSAIHLRVSPPDIVVGVLDADGNVLASKMLGSIYYDKCSGIAISDDGGIYIGGATASALNFDVDTIAGGRGSVYFVAKLGSTVSLDENASVQQGNQLNFYPNPATDAVYVSMGDAGIYQYDLYTLQGQRLAGDRFSGTAVSIPVESLPAGTYILTVQDGGEKRYAGKFTVSR